MDFVMTMGGIQKRLDRAQTTPVVGSLFVSPAKAILSLVQIIASLAVLFSCGHCLDEEAIFATMHANVGFEGLGKSITNILTLEFVGYILTS